MMGACIVINSANGDLRYDIEIARISRNLDIQMFKYKGFRMSST
jgi:hypothetical protein